MKFIFTFLVALIGFNPLFSQVFIVDSGVVLKKGVYLSFEEFKNNSPSESFSREIFSGHVNYGFLGMKGSVITYGIGRKLESGLKVKKVFGFCDGEKIYINQGSSTLDYRPFVEVLYLGRFCYYEGVSNGGGIAASPNASNIKSMSGVIIDINNGKTYSTTHADLRLLFSKFETFSDDLTLYKLEDKALVMKYSNLDKASIRRKGYVEKVVDYTFVFRNKNDSSLEAYESRMLSYKNDPMFVDIQIEKKYFKDGKLKVFNVWGCYSKSLKTTYLYKIGTGYHYHKTGQIQKEENYNIHGKKDRKTVTYNELGEIVKESVYSKGDLIRK